MPFVSQAQQRFAFGTGQPWAERWAKETDFSKLPKRVRRKPLGKRKKAETPQSKVDRLWASGVKKSDIIGIWYSPSDDTWYVSGGDWAESGTGDKVKSIFGPDVIWADEGVPNTEPGSSEAKFTQSIKFKSITIDQLEAFVSSGAYDPDTAGLIAQNISALPSLKGEQIAPGITRIHGNLCNVHGKYGPCDKALSGKKPKGGKGRAARKPAAPKKTDAQRASERDTKRQQNAADVAKRMQDSDTGLSPSGSKALLAFAAGQQPDATQGAGLAQMGLAEQASDGSYRMTPTGHAVVAAMQAGDYQRAIDAISRGTDTQGKRQERTTAQQARREAASKRQQDAQAKRQAAQAKRETAAKKPAKSASGGGKKPEKPAVEKPIKTAPAKRRGRVPPSAGGVSSAPSKKPKPSKAVKPTKEQATAANRAAVRDAMAQADQGLAPGGFDNLIALGGGKEPDQIGADGLISMGMAERGSDGTLRLTSAGRAAIAAANRGDAKAAIDIISRASEPRTTKAQTAEERAMFAKMGGGGSGGGGGGSGGGKSKLWPKGPSGKRTPQAAAAQSGNKPDVTISVNRTDGKFGPRHTYHAKGIGDSHLQVSTRNDGLRSVSTFYLPPSARGKGIGQQMLVKALHDGPIARESGNGVSDAYRRVQDTLIRKGVVKIKKDEYDNSIMHLTGKKMTTKAAGSPGDYLIVEDPQKSTTWHLQVKRGGKPDHGLMGSAWAALHSGFRGNVYQGPNKAEAIAKLKKLYASEGMDMPATKDYSFRVFKDASGRYRWVAQSSTAFQDRDKEIVSTKALADDCDFADRTGSYGPLRWWHAPGIDLGDCDFNAMHGRVLIESGTFRTPAIAQKVADAANELEISLGFLHLPTEPDADGVFHHIRRFERSLVPRGKASNRFTAFTVKDQSMANQFTPEKIAGMKAIGFTDEDIAEFSNNATATEKTADGLLIASKSDEAAVELPDMVINGVTYKAMPPMMAGAAGAADAESPMEDMGEGGMEEPAEEAGGLTLSPEDLSAIGEAVGTALQGAVAQIMGALDLEKKVGAHVAGLMAPYTAQKDASDSEKAEAIAALQVSLKAAETQQAALKAQLDELLGLQPAVVQRPSESASTVVNPWIPSDQQLLGSVKNQVPADQQFAFGDLVENLFGNINGTPGQA